MPKEVKIVAELIDKYFNVRVKLRNDSHENWEKKANDFVPFDGEVIIYDINKQYPIQLLKIGDGVHKIGELPFINDLTKYYTKIEIDNIVSNIYTKIEDNFQILSKEINNLTKELIRVEKDSKVRLELLENNLDYNLYQGEKLINTIKIPQDIYIVSGKIVEQNKLQLNYNNNKSITINLSGLSGNGNSVQSNNYYPFENGQNIQIEIDQIERTIAANLLDGTVDLGKLQPELRQLIVDGVGAGGVFDMELLSEIALTGNVNDLIQYDNTYLILDCN